MTRRFVGMLIAAVVWIPPVRSWIEGSMARHMLLGVPVLVIAGMLLAPTRVRSSWNPGGVPGALIALGFSAVVMIPRVLDAAVQSLAADVIKSMIAVFAGVAFAGSWSLLGVLGQAFVIGNIGWMLGAAGLLMQQAPERLCVVYLQGDQRRAGVGLVVAAVLIVAAWLATAPWRDDVPGQSSPLTDATLR
jgi:hypothetical protein